MKSLITVVLACLCVGQAFAADGSAKPANPSPARMQAAMELLHVLDAQNVTVASVGAMVNAMIQANPMMGPYRAVMMQWAEKTLSWQQMGPKLAPVCRGVHPLGACGSNPILRDAERAEGHPGAAHAGHPGRPARRGDGARAHPELRQMIKARAAQLQNVSP